MVSVVGWRRVDSGSEGILIDEKLADELHMPIVGSGRSVGADGRAQLATWRRGHSFSVGRVTYRSPVFLAVDLSSATAPKGEHRSGVIGYDLFARAVVEYGRGGDEVIICDPSTYDGGPRGHWQRLDFIDQTPAIKTKFEGIERAPSKSTRGLPGQSISIATLSQRRTCWTAARCERCDHSQPEELLTCFRVVLLGLTWAGGGSVTSRWDSAPRLEETAPGSSDVRCWRSSAPYSTM